VIVNARPYLHAAKEVLDKHRKRFPSVKAFFIRMVQMYFERNPCIAFFHSIISHSVNLAGLAQDHEQQPHICEQA